jgi:hypothetical protein
MINDRGNHRCCGDAYKKYELLQTVCLSTLITRMKVLCDDSPILQIRPMNDSFMSYKFRILYEFCSEYFRDVSHMQGT